MSTRESSLELMMYSPFGLYDAEIWLLIFLRPSTTQGIKEAEDKIDHKDITTTATIA